MEIGKKLNFIIVSKPTLAMKERQPPPVPQPIYPMSENKSTGDIVVRFSDKMDIGRNLTFYYEDKTTIPNVDYISQPVLKTDYILDISENRDDIVVCFSDKIHIGKKITFYYKNKPAIPKKDFILPPALKLDYTRDDNENKDDDTLVRFSDKMHIGEKLKFFYEDKTLLPHAGFISIPVLKADYSLQDCKNKDDNIVVCFADKMEIGKKLSFFYENKSTDVDLPLVLPPSYIIHDDQKVDDVLVCFTDKMKIGKKLNFIFESKPTLPIKMCEIPDLGETSTDDLIDFKTETSHLSNSSATSVMLGNSGQYFTKWRKHFDSFSASYV
ncbi:hypothetical protein XELAEV_18009048mg [Xenopus laevis]|nr:hypothetical protein XELAEV_18009048mg [Xenopus laevis]